MDNPTLQIPRDIIEPLIQAQINSAIAAAMGGSENLMTRAVQTVLSTKVNSEGKIDGYSSHNQKMWIDWAVGDALRRAAQKAIELAVEEQHEAMKKEMIRQLSQKNSPLIKRLVQGLADNMFSQNNLKYRLTVDLEK